MHIPAAAVEHNIRTFCVYVGVWIASREQRKPRPHNNILVPIYVYRWTNTMIWGRKGEGGGRSFSATPLVRIYTYARGHTETLMHNGVYIVYRYTRVLYTCIRITMRCGRKIRVATRCGVRVRGWHHRVKYRRTSDAWLLYIILYEHVVHAERRLSRGHVIDTFSLRARADLCPYNSARPRFSSTVLYIYKCTIILFLYR